MNTYRLTFKCGHARNIEGAVAPAFKSAYCFDCKPGSKVMKPLVEIAQVLGSGDVVSLGAPAGVARGHHRDYLAGAVRAAAEKTTTSSRKQRAAERLARIDALKAEAAKPALDPVSEAAAFALINGEDPIAAAAAEQRKLNEAAGVPKLTSRRHSGKDAEAAQGAAAKAPKTRKSAAKPAAPKADRKLASVK